MVFYFFLIIPPLPFIPYHFLVQSRNNLNGIRCICISYVFFSEMERLPVSCRAMLIADTNNGMSTSRGWIPLNSDNMASTSTGSHWTPMFLKEAPECSIFVSLLDEKHSCKPSETCAMSMGMLDICALSGTCSGVTPEFGSSTAGGASISSVCPTTRCMGLKPVGK